jgi:hypothetical protein
MNKKIILIPILGICIIIFLCAFAYSQEDMTVIDNSVFKNPQRPAATFLHDAHNEKAGIDECNLCHHVYENGEFLEYESSEDMLCSDCHALNESDDDSPSLLKAFHTNCKGCHLKENKGPVMCGECHVRRKD